MTCQIKLFVHGLVVILACCVLFCAGNTQEMRKNRLRNRNLEHDANHIRQHLDGVVEINQEEPVKASEQQFQYFKVHDYDNNNMLDGVELRAALTHYHEEENEHQQQVLTEDELASLLDTILQEDDRNKDGYIDYAEFMMSQQ